MNMVDSALETLGDELQNTCITKILVALMGDSGGQKVPSISKFLNTKKVNDQFECLSVKKGLNVVLRL